jgi:hypothetical protein
MNDNTEKCLNCMFWSKDMETLDKSKTDLGICSKSKNDLTDLGISLKADYEYYPGEEVILYTKDQRLYSAIVSKSEEPSCILYEPAPDAFI